MLKPRHVSFASGKPPRSGPKLKSFPGRHVVVLARPQYRDHDIRQRLTERQVLIGIQMNPIDPTGGGDGRGIVEMASQRSADGTVGFGKPRTPVVRSVKLRSNRALRGLDRGRTYDQNRGNRHARL